MKHPAGYQPFPVPLDWPGLLEGPARGLLEEEILPLYLPGCRWFGGKSRTIRSARVAGILPLSQDLQDPQDRLYPRNASAARFFLITVEYANGPGETYLLPLQIGEAEVGKDLCPPSAVLAFFEWVEERTEGTGKAGGRRNRRVLFDAVYDPGFRANILRLIATKGSCRGGAFELHGVAGACLQESAGNTTTLESKVLKAEQSNSSVLYEEKFFLKLYRKIEPGENPDSELLRYLSEKKGFRKVPPYAGALLCTPGALLCAPATLLGAPGALQTTAPMGTPVGTRAPVGGVQKQTLGLLLGAVANHGDAWTYTLQALRSFHERLEKVGQPGQAGQLGQAPPQVLPPLFGRLEPPVQLLELLGEEYPARVRQLAEATGQMHLALASETLDPAFRPEPFTADSQRTWMEGMGAFVRSTFKILREKAPHLGAPGQAGRELRRQAQEVLALEGVILQKQSQLPPIEATITRAHGDFHLGQVLNTGSDFVIIDFEGEPSRSLEERKRKRSPLQDVAGMLRSFHYAANCAAGTAGGGTAVGLLQAWGAWWSALVSRIFLDTYLATVSGASFIPNDPATLQMLLEILLLEKAVYEVLYELNNRPDWLPIPFSGILSLGVRRQDAALNCATCRAE